MKNAYYAAQRRLNRRGGDLIGVAAEVLSGLAVTIAPPPQAKGTKRALAVDGKAPKPSATAVRHSVEVKQDVHVDDVDPCALLLLECASTILDASMEHGSLKRSRPSSPEGRPPLFV